MSGRGNGRGGRGNGRGGRGRGGRSNNRGGGRGQHYAGASSSAKKGMCSALGTSVFDYGQRAAADQMKTSWEKLVQYVGTTYGQDISNELQNKLTVTLAEPTYSAAIMTRHTAREAMVRTGQRNIQAARRAQEAVLQAEANAGDLDARLSVAVIQNQIAQGDYEAAQEVPVELSDAEKTLYGNEWRTYRERAANLLKHRGQTFSLILGQCTQLLQDKMKQDTDWTTVSTSYDPLTLFRLIEKTILAQTEDQYPFATVYDQEHAFYSFRQETMSNAQWYEKFNTRVDVGEAIGVTRHHKVLLEFVAQELHTTDFTALGTVEQAAVRIDAEERYRAYVFLRQSGAQHSNLKMVLQNDFTTGDNHYPKNRQQTLHLLDKFSKTVAPKVATQSEGTAFVQGSGGKKKKPFDEVYWKDKECYECHEKGHPSSHCPNKKKSKESDDQTVASTKSSVDKLKKQVKEMKKKFTTVNTQLEKLKETSDMSGSDSESEEASHFQFQFLQTKADFQPRIAKLFKQSRPSVKLNLDLREVILLDNQSTMDLFCNPAFVESTTKSSSTMRVKSNGGSLVVNHKAELNGYHTEVWYSKRAITNILSLSNIIKQYRVTYDSKVATTFIVHRAAAGKPDMHFRMHASGLHYYDPREDAVEELAFLGTVSENKQGFTKRQIAGAEAARALYTTLCHPSMKDFKWVIRSNQIKDCPVTVEDVDVATKIWGKNIAALKGKTTRSTPSPVAPDFVKVPAELLKLHKEVFLTIDIFFVNKIPFFLSLSRKICFTAVNHLANRTVPEIFKAFKEIYQYYLQRGFRITTVHADGEFEPLAALIQALPGGPTVNLASAHEHVPEIERRIRVVKERCRASRHTLPFKRIPKLLTIYIVFNVVKLLNFFPTKGGISDSLSPKTIMSGETLDFKKHLSLQIGQYCQVHEEEQPRNSQIARTKGAISLGPSGQLARRLSLYGP